MSCKAQTTISLSDFSSGDLKNDNYIKDTNGVLDPFIGTWKWTNGNSEFTVVLEKKEMYNPTYLNSSERINDYYSDVIIGGYKYIENGQVIVNTLNYTTQDAWSSDYAPIFGSFHNNGSQYKIYLKVQDEIIGKLLTGHFEITQYLTLPNDDISPIEATWRVWNREGIYINEEAPPSEISIPEEIVLQKMP